MNFYYEAAKVLERLDTKKGSIKGIIAALPEKSRKRSAALVIETLKYKHALSDIIGSSSLLDQERKYISSRHLAMLLVHDLLMARGGIQASDGPTKQAIMRHKTRLQAELVKLKVKRGVKLNHELISENDSRASQIPRYVRVNTARWTTKEAIVYLTSNGFSRVASPFETKTSFTLDEHVPNLLAFHPATTFHDDAAYQDGRLILQDKASCFPALVLSPDLDECTIALDATAAPGNKTTHLSAIMQGKGRVLAFERDRHRFTTLKCMVAKAGCKNIEPFNADFLSVDPRDSRYAGVSHILLDPSCSGSGIVNRLDYLQDIDQENDDAQEARLGKLSTFQVTMIKHAMKFPGAVKIVYSTCSIHAVENEQVVVTALNSEEARSGRFTLAPRTQVIPKWERRGLVKEMGSYSADSVVRCIPGEDKTNGFFVSCFVREHSSPTGDATSTMLGAKRKAQFHPDDESEKEDAAVFDSAKGGRKGKRRKRKQKKHRPEEVG
ncbi:williams-Beuren syndrome critical region protein 20 copy A [Gautieria morchelliformis]|nr:williams-Beuren syndrome critical region protein 20 copy A [Gautieria morchelliformis]